MKDSAQKPHRSGCPISIALEIFGDRWSLLILRDMIFGGKSTYRQFLDSEEAIATNILSDRLRSLEANGLIKKQGSPTDRRVKLFSVTEKGFALAPMLIEMILWSAAHEDTAAPQEVLDLMVNDRDGFIESLRKKVALDDAETADRQA
ncbi:hypothetical protein PB2503_03447 [Parvularcula bermudensis HTCC2503]|uniref:HTH hxlR-type domain-containing protein n=1 Tax=Parvularcula bermudensis (strain ATCC BAA-594 / HTCC2503 / KCTC 12087) TaxID=314260 RepID=E0TDL0_PARBH|nr:helix-turn-helix domain-containing protein [Parvularcula bermudensis]ADM08765.1 hypothetical protein PB2503_03447 [Parvularcula bermudensis HTCC2503]